MGQSIATEKSGGNQRPGAVFLAQMNGAAEAKPWHKRHHARTTNLCRRTTTAAEKHESKGAHALVCVRVCVCVYPRLRVCACVWVGGLGSCGCMDTLSCKAKWGSSGRRDSDADVRLAFKERPSVSHRCQVTYL